jgi:tetratricopeptide (TPR) repeat protein
MIQQRPFTCRLLVLWWIWLAAGCPSSGPRFVPDPDRAKDLPQDVDALIRTADQLTRGSLAEKMPLFSKVDRALAALERALELKPEDPFEILWRLSRVCFLMTEGVEDTVQRHAFALRGIEYANRARRLQQKRVESHFLLALNTARLAEVTSNAKLVSSIMGAAAEAKKIDETYEDAGPLRLLGKVYITAPAWPVSVGSPEKAVEVLKRAVALAPIPLNRVFLGQAYYHDEEYELAEQELRQALNDGRARHMDERWKKEAQEYLNRIAAGANTDPRTTL